MVEVAERKSKWGKVGKVAAILLVLLITVFAGFFFWTGIPAGAAHYQASREAAKVAGLCLSEEDFWRINAIPETDNAAPLIAKNPQPDIKDAYLMTPKILDEHWKDIDIGLAKLEVAIHRKYLVGPWDFKDRKLQYYEAPVACENARRWFVLLGYVAKNAFLQKNFVRTSRTLRAYARLTVMLDDDHTLVGMQERHLAAGRLQSIVQKMIPDVANSPRWINTLREVIRTIDEPYDLPTMARVEPVRGEASVQNILYQSPDWGYDVITPIEFEKGRLLPKFGAANTTRIYEYYATISPALPKNPYDFAGAEKAIDLGQPLLEQEDWSTAVLRWGMWTPTSLPKMIHLEDAYRHAILQALEILCTHADPAKGLPLAGRYRLDVDDKPIRVKHLPKGWILYSIGQNRIDNEGIPAATGDDDVVVHLSPATVPQKPKPKGSPSK